MKLQLEKKWISKRISKHTEWYFSYDCSHGTICTDKSTLIQISAYENTTQYWWISKRKSKHIKWYLVMAPHSVHRWQQNFAKILVTNLPFRCSDDLSLPLFFHLLMAPKTRDSSNSLINILSNCNMIQKPSCPGKY